LRILVIGAGAIGSLLGGRLALSGHDLTLVGRQPTVEAINSTGLILHEPGESIKTVQPRAFNSLANAFAEKPKFDLALVTVKSFDTGAVARELGETSRSPIPLLTFQNGVGNEELLAEAFGAHRVFAGAIDTPASVPAPGQVRVHRARYRIGLAPASLDLTAAASIAKEFARAGFSVQLFADYRRLKWTKLLMNILANAGSALLNWTATEVMAHPLSSLLEATAWQEALAVMASRGIRPVNLAGYPLRLLAPVARRLPARLLASGLRSLVAVGRGSKLPSLQSALILGQPSEVEWLNGAVVRAGAELSVPTPVNRVLTELLLGKYRGDPRSEEVRGKPEALMAYVKAVSPA
jgi:2-dehydropantoate 2-reductase